MAFVQCNACGKWYDDSTECPHCLKIKEKGEENQPELKSANDKETSVSDVEVPDYISKLENYSDDKQAQATPENYSFFDEKDGKWIEWFKRFVIVLFYLDIIAGFIGGISLCIILESFFVFLLTLLLGAVAAFADLIVGMLILNYLNNIQVIRENIEIISKKNK